MKKFHWIGSSIGLCRMNSVRMKGASHQMLQGANEIVLRRTLVRFTDWESAYLISSSLNTLRSDFRVFLIDSFKRNILTSSCAFMESEEEIKCQNLTSGCIILNRDRIHSIHKFINKVTKEICEILQES
uniref:Uncharacterized protein n=1 Tax=Rhizophagus irregularis (strain DAOM 181602 / DAOM 197198 / MUCL 43194) TaxID=747089 RepID=U9SZP2_RHIID